MNVAVAKNEVLIRLTDERWQHITTGHPEIASYYYEILEAIETPELKDLQTVLPYFLRHKTVWSSYDSDADVLYLHFRKPNHADNSEMTEDEIIVRYANEEIIGMTILNASERLKNKNNIL